MIEFERYIIEALQKAVIALNLTIPVKYLGMSINPPNDGKWLEIVHIPNNLQGEFWSEGKTYRGVMRLVLHWPMNSSGLYPALDMVRTIASGFTKGTQLSDTGNNVTVSIVEHTDVKDVIEDPPEIIIPLSVRYSCFKRG